MAKEQIKMKITALKGNLKAKERELMTQEGFYDNSYTLDSITNISAQLDDTETFLALTTNDPTALPEIEKQFNSSLSWIDRRIKDLQIIKI